jgi:hypothetical protein
MTYNGRRGPNVSEYIANLNAIPTAQDLQSSNQDSFLEDDLALFTNTQFFDFDIGQEADLAAGSYAEGQSAADNFDGKGLDFASGQWVYLWSTVCICYAVALLFCGLRSSVPLQ